MEGEKPERLSAEQLYVETQIEAAQRERRRLPDDVARIVAGWYHDGQGSAFYSFASSGAIDADRLASELVATLNAPHATDEQRRHIEELAFYWAGAPDIDREGNRGPVPGWHEATKMPEYQPVPADETEDEEQDPEDVEDYNPDPIEVFVACEAARQERGILHGVWIDFTQDKADIDEAIAYMLSRSPVPDATEIVLDDFNGFHGLKLDQYEDISAVWEIAKGIEEHGEGFAALVDILGIDRADEAREHWHDFYLGQYDSIRHYATCMWGELEYDRYLDELPDHVRPFVTVDFDDFGAHLTINQRVVELSDGGFAIFDTNR